MVEAVGEAVVAGATVGKAMVAAVALTRKRKLLCAFYITKSHDGKNDGCKRQPCTWAHQKYSEDVAKQAWVTEFLKRNKRTLDPAKKA